MYNVKEYLMSVFSVVLLSGAINLFANTKAGNIYKYVKYAVSLVFVLVMVTPVFSMIKGIPDYVEAVGAVISESEQYYREEYEGVKGEEGILFQVTGYIENKIEEALYEKFKINGIIVHVKIDSEDISALEITEISVTSETKIKEFLRYDIEKYLGENFNCPIVFETNREE